MINAYRTRLTESSVAHCSQIDEPFSTLLLAEFSGEQSLKVLQSLANHPVKLAIDLTTQSLQQARQCHDYCNQVGVVYVAGGVTGGARQAKNGELFILLGSDYSSFSDPPEWIQMLGHVMTFPSLDVAIKAKLLHNFVAISFNQILGTTLDASCKDLLPKLGAVLENGTAGRPISEMSAYRDFFEDPISSYSIALVNKDLKAVNDTFPDLFENSALDLEKLLEIYHPSPSDTSKPFTSRIIQ